MCGFGMLFWWCVFYLTEIFFPVLLNVFYHGHSIKHLRSVWGGAGDLLPASDGPRVEVVGGRGVEGMIMGFDDWRQGLRGVGGNMQMRDHYLFL